MIETGSYPLVDCLLCVCVFDKDEIRSLLKSLQAKKDIMFHELFFGRK